MRRVYMETDRRLHWVMANRTPRGTIPQIGVMIGGLVEGALRYDSEQRVQLASVVANCVDQEFRRHCRMGDLHNGMLAIEVDEPGLISILRARWASKIESALRKGGAKTWVRRVLFRFGRSGDRIPVNANVHER
jgi:Dna[CI] antecedent, DciA